MSKHIKEILARGNNERGSVTILVALSMTAIIGFLSLVVDVGLLYETRHQLQTAVDGAVLAGARELPQSPANAIAKAREYAGYNGVSDAEITSLSVASIYNANDAVEIRAEREVGLGFARVLGISASRVEASATALAAQLKPKALWPIALPDDDDREGYTVLTMGPPGHEEEDGSVKGIDYPPLGGTPDYTNDFTYGWDNVDGVMPSYTPPDPYSWWVDVKTGNNVSATRDAIDGVASFSAANDPPSCILADPQGYDPDNPPAGFTPSIECYRVRYLPLVSEESWEAAQGNSLPVEITRFVPVYLVGYTNGSHGTINIQVVFLRNAQGTGEAMIGAPLTGLIGARMWR